MPELPNFFTEASFHSRQSELRRLINRRTGETVVAVDEGEMRILLTKGIGSRENPDGSFQLIPRLTMQPNPGRKFVIDALLGKTLPTVLTDLISSYVDEIEISGRNECAIIDTLKATDQVVKGAILAAASNQGQILFLNKLLVRLREQGFTLNFSKVDMSNLDLTAIDLSGTDLTGAVMHGCDLRQAKLHNATMVNTNLNGASLVHAELNGANLTDARLIRANLRFAKLRHVILVRAVLKFADLESVDLSEGSDLTDAHFDHVTLDNADLTSCVMINVSLDHASLIGTTLDNSNLSKAKLTNAILQRSNLRNVNLTDADLSDSDVDDVTLTDNPKVGGIIWRNARADKIHADLGTLIQLPLSIFLPRVRCTYLLEDIFEPWPPTKKINFLKPN